MSYSPFLYCSTHFSYAYISLLLFIALLFVRCTSLSSRIRCRNNEKWNHMKLILKFLESEIRWNWYCALHQSKLVTFFSNKSKEDWTFFFFLHAQNFLLTFFCMLFYRIESFAPLLPLEFKYKMLLKGKLNAEYYVRKSLICFCFVYHNMCFKKKKNK